ncbi:MAG: hypothetical protein H6706_04705 [Myxococcales bacterium]|nr:hypothetical protein [Myxococcales bacterium]
MTLLLVLLTAASAHADEESDRRRAISDAERLVQDIASALSGLAGSSGDSGIGRAASNANRLESSLRDLDRVKGNDSKAREMVSRWPRYCDQVEAAGRPLRTLKQGQHDLKSLDDDCARQLRDLQQTIKAELGKGGPQSERTITERARSIGRQVKSALDKAGNQQRELERARSDARRFDASGGPWSNVRSNIHDAADRMYDGWKRDYENGKRACGDLARGEGHPEVARALDTLRQAERQRADLKKRAQEGLRAVVSASGGLEGARDAGPIGRLRSALGDVQERVKALDRVKGGDPEARAITEAWPRAAAGFTQRLKALETLKGHQRSLDGVAEGCGTTEKSLLAQATAAADRPEAKTQAALVAAAQAAGAEAKKTLEGARKRGDEVKRARGEAAGAGGPGDWQAAGSALKASADKMADEFGRAATAVETRCGPLAQGDRHPGVARALQSITAVLERVDNLFKALGTDVNTLAGHLKGAGGARDAAPVEAARGTLKTIRGRLAELERDDDPRAQTRSKAWLGGLGSLDGALKGLETIKTRQGELDAPTKACEAENATLERAAGDVKVLPDLVALEAKATAAAKTASGGLAAGDTLDAALRKAQGEARGFGYSDGPWSGVQSALQGSADAAYGAFKAAHGRHQKACGDLALGPRHPIVLKTRKALETRSATAEAAMKAARDRATSACARLPDIVSKRDQRARALQTILDGVLKRGKLDTRPETIKVLRDSVDQLGAELVTAGKACEAAMAANAEADTAWEALQGR